MKLNFSGILFVHKTLQHMQRGTSRQRSGKGAIRKRFPLQKPRWEKTKLTIRYLYHETYRKPNEQLTYNEPNRSFSYELRHDKTRFLPMRKQRRRSASQLQPLAIFCDCTAWLCRTWSGTLKTGFLASQLICSLSIMTNLLFRQFHNLVINMEQADFINSLS